MTNTHTDHNAVLPAAQLATAHALGRAVGQHWTEAPLAALQGLSWAQLYDYAQDAFDEDYGYFGVYAPQMDGEDIVYRDRQTEFVVRPNGDAVIRVYRRASAHYLAAMERELKGEPDQAALLLDTIRKGVAVVTVHVRTSAAPAGTEESGVWTATGERYSAHLPRCLPRHVALAGELVRALLPLFGAAAERVISCLEHQAEAVRQSEKDEEGEAFEQFREVFRKAQAALDEEDAARRRANWWVPSPPKSGGATKTLNTAAEERELELLTTGMLSVVGERPVRLRAAAQRFFHAALDLETEQL